MGDLERDYNLYSLSPTNYSQGNGNFRDINQNRRSDLLINPDVGASHVEHFYNPGAVGWLLILWV